MKYKTFQDISNIKNIREIKKVDFYLVDNYTIIIQLGIIYSKDIYKIPYTKIISKKTDKNWEKHLKDCDPVEVANYFLDSTH